MVSKLDSDDDPEESMKKVKALRHTHDKTLATRADCAGALELVQELLQLRPASQDCISGLKAEETKLKGFVASCDVLQGRISNATDLVSFGVAIFVD